MWKRLDAARLRNIGGPFAIEKLVYGQDGKDWPRLAIGLYEGHGATDPTTFRIGCSLKGSPSENWEAADIPRALMADLIDLLQRHQGTAPTSLP